MSRHVDYLFTFEHNLLSGQATYIACLPMALPPTNLTTTVRLIRAILLKVRREDVRPYLLTVERKEIMSRNDRS